MSFVAVDKLHTYRIMRLTTTRLRRFILDELRLIEAEASTDDEREDDLKELLTVARDLILIIKRLQKERDFNYSNDKTRVVMSDLKKNIKSMSSFLDAYSNAL